MPTSERDLSFLVEATRLLAASLDVETTLATVARLSLPHLGSWCMVDLLEAGHMRRLAIIHPDPARQALAQQLQEGWPPLRDDPLGLPSAMRTRRSQVVFPVTDTMLVGAARSPENLALLRRLQIGSFMTIPLLARGEVLGAITYVSPNHGDSFTPDDLVLGEDLAARAAIAIDNARLMREAERALAAAELSEERFSRIISIAAEAIISIDETQRIVLFNEGAEYIFGYGRGEMLGKPLDLLLPERARAVHQRHVRAFGESPDVARKMGHRQEISGRRKDGEEFPAEASISKMDVGGQRFYIVVLRDTTEARNAVLAQEKLLLAVTRATEARARLLRGVTHDVKNPLGSADGYAQLLEMELAGGLAPEQARLVAGVRRGIRGALAMIGDLLDLSLAESGGLPVNRVPVDLVAVAREALEDERGAVEAAGHVLVCEGGTPVPLVTDPARVRQVVGNLLSNAAKYTPAPGRITLWVEMRTGGEPARPGEWAAVHVRDSGPGIPPDARESIFGEFHRLDSSTRASGHGLGLAISRLIARLLGGDLTVSGGEGEGATFSFWLPSGTDA
ncbi:MAG TPA: GAF domain-containing sensor histidine kinase [Longimicrobiaceae bacterium]|nr:GAF domain-containing sensor histidine kinase [Longimicrobiaceae bacterium]